MSGFDENRVEAMKYVDTEWVMAVDADERVTPELASRIRALIDSNKFDVIAFPVLTWVWGRFLTSLSHFDKKYAFRVNNGKFLPTMHNLYSFNPDSRKVNIESACLLHYSHPSLHHTVNKTNRFTDFISREYHENGKKFKKINLLTTMFRTLAYYLVKTRTYRDGVQGIFFAVNSAYTDMLALMKLYEIEKGTLEMYEKKILE